MSARVCRHQFVATQVSMTVLASTIRGNLEHRTESTSVRGRATRPRTACCGCWQRSLWRTAWPASCRWAGRARARSTSLRWTRLYACCARSSAVRCPSMKGRQTVARVRRCGAQTTGRGQSAALLQVAQRGCSVCGVKTVTCWLTISRTFQLSIDAGQESCCRAGADHGGGAALLQKALQLVVGVALRDAAARGPEFNGRPFFRVFIGLFNELASLPGAQETAELPYLVSSMWLYATSDKALAVTPCMHASLTGLCSWQACDSRACCCLKRLSEQAMVALCIGQGSYLGAWVCTGCESNRCEGGVCLECR